MEGERRFDGEPYPKGMCKFPGRLPGQGFFPGGDGLWRDDSRLNEPSNGRVAVGGAAFFGNDWGTRSSFAKISEKGSKNVPTWRHLKSRIGKAGIPSNRVFFTNVIMGLREEGTALQARDWQADQRFSDFCLEFLRFQLDFLKPKVVVAMGSKAQEQFNRLADITKLPMVFTTHPYADFGLTEDRLKQEIDKLKAASSKS